MVRLLIALMMLPMSASAADDVKFTYLEQEVRNLQRQVQALTRQVDELRNRPSRPDSPRSRATALPAAEAAADDLPRWVDAALWKTLRPGMSEMEVIASLGPPNSMRDEGELRVLLYALEIGSSGFLGGSVKLRDRAVVDVASPTLQ